MAESENSHAVDARRSLTAYRRMDYCVRLGARIPMVYSEKAFIDNSISRRTINNVGSPADAVWLSHAVVDASCR